MTEKDFTRIENLQNEMRNAMTCLVTDIYKMYYDLKDVEKKIGDLEANKQLTAVEKRNLDFLFRKYEKKFVKTQIKNYLTKIANYEKEVNAKMTEISDQYSVYCYEYSSLKRIRNY